MTDDPIKRRSDPDWGNPFCHSGNRQMEVSSRTILDAPPSKGSASKLVSVYGRAEYATKAIQEYRAAIENDPGSEYLNAGLAELYAKTGRIRDAVLEAQDILKRDPNNLEARKLLGRIYLRSLGDLQAGTQSQEVLKLAIEQFQKIVQLEPKNVDNHLLLGRLYRLNSDLVKAESEFKTAIQI